MPDHDNPRPHWSGPCSAFFDFWNKLRGNARMPTFEAFADATPSKFLPSIYIIEITATALVMRFQGAELAQRWNADITGSDLHHLMPETTKEQVSSNVRHVVTHPCGFVGRSTLATSEKRRVTTDNIQLPLGVSKTRPPRLICYSVLNDVEIVGDGSATFLHMHRAEWLDIGAGVPALEPYMLGGQALNDA